MPGLEPLILDAVWTAGKTVVQKFVENRADEVVWSGVRSGWKALEQGSAEDPLNHHLQRAARRAYLKAALEVAKEADLEEAAKRIQADIKDLKNWYADKAIEALDVLLLPAEKAQQQRRKAYQESVAAMLAADVYSWGAPDPAPLRAAFERYMRLGWGSETKRRTFQGVMTVYFLESVKANAEARRVFQTQLLAEIVNREPEKLAPVANFDAFYEKAKEQWDRIEQKVDLLGDKFDAFPERLIEAFEKRGWKPPEAQKPFAKLDRYPASFVDRPKLRGWLEERINEDRNACLLWGGPGTGKSTLALEAGYRAHEAGRTVVQQFCGPDRGYEAVGIELAAAVPGDDEKADPKVRIARALRWLRERAALVILDDIWDEAVTKLAPGPPAFTLFTSRRADTAHLPEAARKLAGGFEPEESEELIENRLPGWLATDGEALRAFARRVEHLPYALEVAVRLMEGDPRPRAQAVERVRAVALRSGELDLDGLLREAVAALPEDAQRLLHAVALCAPEGVWLPFAGEVAGLEAGLEGGAAGGTRPRPRAGLRCWWRWTGRSRSSGCMRSCGGCFGRRRRGCRGGEWRWRRGCLGSGRKTGRSGENRCGCWGRLRRGWGGWGKRETRRRSPGWAMTHLSLRIVRATS